MRIAFLLSVVLLACGSDAGSDGGTSLSSGACPPGSTLTYASFGQAFVSEHCGECHSGRESPTLKTQAQVQANANKIYREAVSSSRMPEGASLSASQRQQLGEWLTCGAP